MVSMWQSTMLRKNLYRVQYDLMDEGRIVQSDPNEPVEQALILAVSFTDAVRIGEAVAPFIRPTTASYRTLQIRDVVLEVSGVYVDSTTPSVSSGVIES